MFYGNNPVWEYEYKLIYLPEGHDVDVEELKSMKEVMNEYGKQGFALTHFQNGLMVFSKSVCKSHSSGLQFAFNNASNPTEGGNNENGS